MHTQISFRFWLLIVATVLGVAACTAKLQRSTQPNQATASSTPQTAQSAKANEKIDTTLTLEKLRKKDYPRSLVNTTEYYLDTAITNHLPHFNAQELLTYYRFLFDLGKEDSMHCPRYNNSPKNYTGGYYYEYYYYYKGILVSDGVIDMDTNYGDGKIYRVRVRYKRIKDLDVTPQMSIKEATEKTIEALRFEQGLAGIGKGGSGYYVGVDTPYYRGLSISQNRLCHNFIWRYQWSMMVEDKSGIAFARKLSDHLCDACDFSTASYTTQTVPTYSNANFVWWVITLFIKNAPPMFYFWADKIQDI